MLSSPRKPSSTIRILSSAEKCRRVARRMSFTTRSAGALGGDFFKEDLGFIFVPSSLRSEEHTSELQSLMRISYAVFCLKKKKLHTYITTINKLQRNHTK